MKTNINVQAEGNNYDITGIDKRVKDDLKAQGLLVKDIPAIDLYVQPIAGLCYYVADVKGQNIEGKIEL